MSRAGARPRSAAGRAVELAAVSSPHCSGGKEPGVLDLPPHQIALRLVQDGQPGLVHQGDHPREVGGDEAAVDRLDDVAVHHLQVGQILALFLQLPLRLARQVRGQQGHGVEAETVNGEVVDHPSDRHQGGRRSRRMDFPGIGQDDQAAVEDVRGARDGDAGTPAQQGRGHRDDDQVEEGEGALDAAIEVDDDADQHQVAAELDVGLELGVAAQDAPQGDVHQRLAARQPEQIEDRAPGDGRPDVAGLRRAGSDLEQGKGDYRRHHGHQPDGDVPTELAGEVGHGARGRPSRRRRRKASSGWTARGLRRGRCAPQPILDRIE